MNSPVVAASDLRIFFALQSKKPRKMAQSSENRQVNIPAMVTNRNY